ncbi:MAG TPA: ribonuclease E/G, partial [Blastocatellia bacterium]|nr:ribonuclease E/G [Blastocatellia bacterium]
MTKELIVSANVHEKKVAILEDGVVTEFYVERRDENQGVVGNLYKGRVMKVLPGMQSAFVDIGLERDAFLYVSDFTEFMEEEEEIDFREAATDESRAARQQRSAERDRRAGRPQVEPVASIARSTAATTKEEEGVERPVRIEDIVEQLAEIADESLIPPPPPEEDLGEGALAESPIAEEAEVAPVEVWTGERIFDEPLAEGTEEYETEGSTSAEEATEVVDEKPRRGRSRKKTEKAGTTKTSRSTKRGAKTEEAAEPSAGTGRRKSSARSGTRRGSRKQAPRADSEPESMSAEEVDARMLERITDDDLAQDAGDLLKDAIVQEKIIEQVHDAEYRTGNVSYEPEPEWRVGSFRSQFGEGAGFQRIVDETAEAVSHRDELSTPHAAEPESSDEPISDFVAEEAYEGAGAEATRTVASGSDYESQISDEPRSMTAEGLDSSNLLDASGVEFGSDSGYEEDREAEIRDRGSRAEFAQRRGGRGRRRSPRREQVEAKAQAADEESPATSSVTAETDAKPPVEATRPASQRGQEPRQDRRGDGYRRPEQGAGRRPERGGPPTISELLHEGQEILVQIAKEPIAKKGARITSHMALPGRYLVYMPTVNHVGVSRKIPNEGERIRLKRVVAMLREREGAAGGFIARTACAGHTEQELHDDLKYLIRTWADIRKKADRAKSPALVHRDLDLVQRILRDQLSEEFSAIRVDNEVEYARIVEFVNRVQPKLVKRVKLYTGNQPILEKYTVQPEIDKAVRPRVWLKSGGYIVINQTEALVAIDVNTGKFVGKSDKLEDTI